MSESSDSEKAKAAREAFVEAWTDLERACKTSAVNSNYAVVAGEISRARLRFDFSSQAYAKALLAEQSPPVTGTEEVKS